MFKKNFKSIEIVKTIKQLNIGKTIQTSSNHKIADVKANIALRKGTEKNNVLRNEVRMKKEIEATCNSPISCLDRDDFGCYSIELSSI